MSSQPAGKPRRSALLAPENRRTLYGLIAGVLVLIFALVNTKKVGVDWVFGTWRTPLIVVIAVSFVLGAIAGWFAARHRAKS